MSFTDIFDMHTHSEYSFDGNHSCEDLCKAAIEKGITGIAITDHCDIDGEGSDFFDLCKRQTEDIAACKLKYNTKKFTVITGLELGQGIYRKEESLELLNSFDYDFVLGSIHNLENMQDFYFLDYSILNVYELLDEYFNAIIELCEWGCFDSLAHLTYPLRYIKGKYNIDIDLNRFSAKIDNILKLLAENNKALEINTSELCRDLGDFMPSAAVVSRFKELGGRFITIGSDNHFAEKLGNGVQEALKMAQDCGFEYQTVYYERQPIRMKIR